MPLPSWSDPPGYREALAALRDAQTWRVVTGPHGNVATIRVSRAALATAPYQWLNRPGGAPTPRGRRGRQEVAIQAGLGLLP